MAIPAWTKEEKAHLESLEGKLDHVRDLVRGVARHFHTGLFLHGEGGTSKSYTVLQELKDLRAKYVYHNTRLTARGLVDSLQRSPTDIHFIEDAETLLEDKKSFGVLRAALWSQSRKKPPEREITWTVFRTTTRFVFTGGIIVISNANLSEQIAEIRAIKTRINVVGLDITNLEIRALMKKISSNGYEYGEDYITPDECWEVATFIIDRLEVLHRNLDLRLVMNGFKDYLQYKTGNAVNHWQALLEGRMAERVVYQGRADLKAEQQKIALTIHTMKQPSSKKIEQWTKATGLGQAAYYRALQRKK